MRYLQRHIGLREECAKLLPGARSAVCVALLYGRPRAESAARATGRVAQYARGRDYHVVVRRRLETLIAALRERLDEPFEARAFVDTGPILERELAAQAGIGWVGKNTLVLNQDLGSLFFLGEVLTTLDLAPDAPATDHCGSCTRCLDACPTGAFPAPYQMDASRCISYLTIERREPIPDAFHEAMGDWVFGCDICQDVCPFNRRAPAGRDPEIMEHRIPDRIPLETLVGLRSGEYRRLVRHTAARRATRAMWQRNAQIAAQNVGGAGG